MQYIHHYTTKELISVKLFYVVTAEKSVAMVTFEDLLFSHLSSNTPWVKQLVLNYSFDCQGNDHLKKNHPVSIYMDNYGNNRLENNV